MCLSKAAHTRRLFFALPSNTCVSVFIPAALARRAVSLSNYFSSRGQSSSMIASTPPRKSITGLLSLGKV